MWFAKGLATLDYEGKASLLALWQAEKGLGPFFWNPSPARVERFRQNLLDGGLIRVELEWKSFLEWASGCKSPTSRGQLEKALLATAAEALGLQHSGWMSDHNVETAIFERFIEMQCKQLERCYHNGVRQDPRFERELRSHLDRELRDVSNLDPCQVQQYVGAPPSIVNHILMHLQNGRLMEIFRDAPTRFGFDASQLLTGVARAVTQTVGLRLPAGLWEGLIGFASPLFDFGAGLIMLISEVIRSVRQVKQERRYRWAVLLVSLGYLRALQRGHKWGWWTRFILRCLDFFRNVWRRLLRFLR